MTLRMLLAKPSAFVPLVLSAAALLLVLGYVMIVGVSTDPSGDEGATARLFQLMIAAQPLIMLSFAVRWLPQATRPALLVLALQAAAAAIPVATILLLESR
jgi:hypothetical protein